MCIRDRLPIGVFLVLYLGLGILFEYVLKIPMGFYNVPIVVAFLEMCIRDRCTDLSIYHPCNTVQFRREELPGDHRYPDGKCLCGIYFYAAAVRTDRKPYFCRFTSGLCIVLPDSDVLYVGKDI